MLSLTEVFESQMNIIVLLIPLDDAGLRLVSAKEYGNQCQI